MTPTIILATGNQGKVQEFNEICGGKIRFVPMSQIGFNQEIVEDGSTFAANAHLKAQAVFAFAQATYPDHWVLADDSGLEVSALGGAPGIYSARYAGENASSKDRYTKLLSELGSASDRSAQFVCVLCLIRPASEPLFFEGISKGNILHAPAGESGFGYDPVFEPEGYSVSFGQMPEAQKNTLSHRGRAVAKLLDYCEGL